MDYKALIGEAITRNSISRYKLAQLLGFKQVSGIYLVERGKAGLSAEKLEKLLQLAGKIASLLVTVALVAGFVLEIHERQQRAARPKMTVASIDRQHMMTTGYSCRVFDNNIPYTHMLLSQLWLCLCAIVTTLCRYHGSKSLRGSGNTLPA